MIQSTQLTTVPSADSSALQRRVAEGAESSQSFPDLLSGATDGQQVPGATTSADSGGTNLEKGDIAAYLYEILGSSSAPTINEEQLFAGLIKERLVALKGEEAGAAYDAALKEQLASTQRADGYMFMEDGARGALKYLQEQGLVTLEEAEIIHAQAFQAAQLDSNKNALYDSRGSTQSTASTETAMESALATLLKFDSGELQSGRMSLSFRQGQQTSGASAVAVATEAMTAGATADGVDMLSGSLAPEITGIRWNPDSKDVRTLAVVMPSKLQDIDRAYVTDTQGNMVEEGRHTSEDKGRLVYRFNEKGDAYPSPSILNVEMGNGSVYRFRIDSPGSMTTDVTPYVS